MDDATIERESDQIDEEIHRRRRRRAIPTNAMKSLRLARSLAGYPMCKVGRVRHRLAPATGDSVLGIDLDWPARVAEVAPHFVAHFSTKFVRQGC
jgi:hypothetical protein